MNTFVFRVEGEGFNDFKQDIQDLTKYSIARKGIKSKPNSMTGGLKTERTATLMIPQKFRKNN